MREIVNAILYQARTGCQWRYLPLKSAVYYYFANWRDDGTAKTIHDLLRCQQAARGPHRRRPGLADGTGLGERAERHYRAGSRQEEPGPQVGHRRRRPRPDHAGTERLWEDHGAVCCGRCSVLLSPPAARASEVAS
ncbi:transposase [Streptomyces sp. NPDC051016]|uniref:transposase n=1 Tax=Streptomyces sp. NPDC051016 TaxID=3365638 RepID=UPI0037ABF775